MAARTAEPPVALVEVVAASGLEENELQLVLEAVQRACRNAVGLDVDTTRVSLINNPQESSKEGRGTIIGALGRVLLIRTNLDDESVQHAIADEMDQLLYTASEKESALLGQPVLISVIQKNSVQDNAGHPLPENLKAIIEQEVNQYEMTKPLPPRSHLPVKKDAVYMPSFCVELDAAHTENSFLSTTFWDTSSILVFDNLVNEDLRRRLLDVTLGRDAGHRDEWDDVVNGPNPSRFVRGGLLDFPDDEENKSEDENTDSAACWGLMDEAVEDLCSQRHDAIEEFESILSDLFPQFVVTRLPEAVFGSCVSPLTANAPTNGDHFQDHIDGDPNLTPPSPWTDVYGRYPNRIAGKPRFMSALVYLNDEWNREEWGASTRFLDTPTGKYYQVLPTPGRVVIMDQDMTHSVEAPTAAAGKRPRYSLVWKLILHPKTRDQDMTNLAGKRNWPDPVLFGSAKQ